MAYTPTDWQDGVTPVDEAHMDHVEAGLVTADANASAALAALPAKENKSEKGAVNGYAPLDAGSKVPVANLPALGSDLSFDGDWAAGTYQDGDTVVKDGVVFMCVGGPTAVAPDASLWGSVGGGIPPLSNGKWLKVQGGAMLWADLPSYGIVSVAAANTDAPAPAFGCPIHSIQGTPGGGTLRSIASPVVTGTVAIVRCFEGGSAFTVLHNGAGAPAQSSFSLRGAANLVLRPGDSITLMWDGVWNEVSRNVAPGYTLIQELVGTGASPTLSFTAIPQIYRHLRLEWRLRSSQGAETQALNLRINGLTSGYLYQDNGGDNGFNSEIRVGEIPGSTMSANSYAVGHAEFPYYSQVGKPSVTWTSFSRRAQAGTAADAAGYFGGGFVDTSGAVTQIDLIAAAGNMIAASIASLYGVT